jgi:hypothetical protein
LKSTCPLNYFSESFAPKGSNQSLTSAKTIRSWIYRLCVKKICKIICIGGVDEGVAILVGSVAPFTIWKRENKKETKYTALGVFVLPLGSDFEL